MQTEKNTPRQQAGLDTKWQIFYTAMEMMQEKPFDEVKIKDICAKVGISVGAFYHHYPSKEHLLKEDYHRVDTLLETFTDVLIETDPIKRIVEYACIYSQTAQDAGPEIVTEVYRVWLTLRTSFPASYQHGVLMRMYHLVKEAKASGQLSLDLDAKQFALDILTTARGVIYHWCQLKGSFDVAEKTGQMVSAFVSYYIQNDDVHLVRTR
jgi:AcrR family transcriptional regulator